MEKGERVIRERERERERERGREERKGREEGEPEQVRNGGKLR